MSASCRCGCAKSEPDKVAMAVVPKAKEATSKQPAASSEKCECCKGTPADHEEHRGGC